MIQPDVGDMFLGLVYPTIPSNSVRESLALVGSIIMPHNFYLHSALVNTRAINNKNDNEVQKGFIYKII